MRLTQVDFVAPASSRSRLGMVLLVLGVLLAGLAVMDDDSRGDEMAQARAALDQARVAYQRATADKAPKPGMELAGFKQSGDIARRLASPWGELLDALEHADNANIALLAVEVDTERGRLQLSGEARNLQALVDYIKALDGKAGILDLRLTTQQIKEKDAQQPIEFVLESNWLRRPQRANAGGATS